MTFSISDQHRLPTALLVGVLAAGATYLVATRILKAQSRLAQFGPAAGVGLLTTAFIATRGETPLLPHPNLKGEAQREAQEAIAFAKVNWAELMRFEETIGQPGWVRQHLESDDMTRVLAIRPLFGMEIDGKAYDLAAVRLGKEGPWIPLGLDMENSQRRNDRVTHLRVNKDYNEHRLMVSSKSLEQMGKEFCLNLDRCQDIMLNLDVGTVWDQTGHSLPDDFEMELFPALQRVPVANPALTGREKKLAEELVEHFRSIWSEIPQEMRTDIRSALESDQMATVLSTLRFLSYREGDLRAIKLGDGDFVDSGINTSQLPHGDMINKRFLDQWRMPLVYFQVGKNCIYLPPEAASVFLDDLEIRGYGDKTIRSIFIQDGAVRVQRANNGVLVDKHTLAKPLGEFTGKPTFIPKAWRK